MSEGFNASFGVTVIQAQESIFRALNRSAGFNASFGVTVIQAMSFLFSIIELTLFQCLIRRDGHSSDFVVRNEEANFMFQCLIRRDGHSSGGQVGRRNNADLFQCLIRRDGHSSGGQVGRRNNADLFQCLIRRDGHSSPQIRLCSSLSFICFNASFGVTVIQARTHTSDRRSTLRFQCLIRRDGHSSFQRLTRFRRNLRLFQCLIRRDGHSSFGMWNGTTNQPSFNASFGVTVIQAEHCFRHSATPPEFQCLIRRDGHSSEKQLLHIRDIAQVSMPHSA